MRISAPDGTPPFAVPWDYHLSLQSWVTEAVRARNERLADEMHKSETAPPYAFSRLVPTKQGHTDISEQHGLQMDDAVWFFTSDNQAVVEAIVEAAQEGAPPMKLGHTQLPVENVSFSEVLPYEEATEYVTLSPIAVSMRRGGQQKYLPYDDPMWGRRAVELCRRQQAAWYEEGPSDEFQFDIRAVNQANVTTRKSPGGHRQVDCTVARLTIAADAQTSYHIQLQGVGARTGQGFGFVLPRKDIPDVADPEVQ